MLSHGFLNKVISKEKLKIVIRDVKEFIKTQELLNSYYSNIDKKIPSVLKLINLELFEDIKKLLNNESLEICNVELHIQFKKSKGIPLHQDNFYHCIKPQEGLKILIPLQKMENYKGSLTFFDCDVDFPIQKHTSSNISNFSSEISKRDIEKLELTKTSYKYNLSDASYHFLNSIHFSNGNISKTDKFFLVFRYQIKNAEVDYKALNRYSECLKKHQEIVNYNKTFNYKY